MSHCPFKIAVVQTSVYFVGGDLATVRIFRLSVMTRCHKVIVDFIFIACEQALHSKGQAEQAAREHASEQLAARGRGKPILSPPPPPNPLTHPPPSPPKPLLFTPPFVAAVPKWKDCLQVSRSTFCEFQ